MENAKENEWIARYSGTPLTAKENDRRRHSRYRVQIHKNLFLDAENQKYFEGRFINDARNSEFEKNARFAADYDTNICTNSDHVWVRIYVTKNIEVGEELFIDYARRRLLGQ